MFVSFKNNVYLCTVQSFKQHQMNNKRNNYGRHELASGNALTPCLNGVDALNLPLYKRPKIQTVWKQM